VDECKFNNGECSQVCVDTYDSYYCTCRQGYRLTQYNYTCPGNSCHLKFASAYAALHLIHVTRILVSGYKLLVLDTCIRLHVSGVNAALDKPF